MELRRRSDHLKHCVPAVLNNAGLMVTGTRLG
jgi:hypothetical protein